MFSLSVRDQILIAHSLKGELFGPAQRLHGATYVVDLELRREQLDPNGVVADISRAGELLREVLAVLNYRNLDEEPAFRGHNTTTEFLARNIWERLAAEIRAGHLGVAADDLASLRVSLHESPSAWAGYEAAL